MSAAIDIFWEKYAAFEAWYDPYWQRARRCRVVRAVERYLAAEAYILAESFAYVALFSLAAAVVLLFVVLGWFFSTQENIPPAVGRLLELYWPTLDGPSRAELWQAVRQLTASHLSVAGLFSFLVLLYSARRIVTTVRVMIRRCFALPATGIHWALAQLRDLASFVVIGLGAGAVLAVTILTSRIGQGVLRDMGFVRMADWVSGAGVWAAIIAVDSLIFLVLLRGAAGVKVPLGDLLVGALAWTAGSETLRWAGGFLIGSVHNPLLASATALVTILLWFNLLGNWLLLVCSWVANPPVGGALDLPSLPAAQTQTGA